MTVGELIVKIIDTDCEFWIFSPNSGILWNGDIFDAQEMKDHIKQKKIKYFRIEEQEITINLEDDE